MNTKPIRPFKEGDRVWAQERGYGVVVHAQHKPPYSVAVNFDEKLETYTKDGVRVEDCNRVLFHVDEITVAVKVGGDEHVGFVNSFTFGFGTQVYPTEEEARYAASNSSNYIETIRISSIGREKWVTIKEKEA